MFYEYAVEPSVLSSWDRTRLFLDAFGPWKGRFLAEYPRRWKKMVFEGLNCPDHEKKRIEVRLQQLDPRVFSARANAPYERDGRTWLQNAEAEHKRQPFRAIVAELASAQPPLLCAAEVDDRCDLWRVESGQITPRQPDAFLQAIRLLLDGSKRVVMIDPYFRADQNDKTELLVALVSYIGTKATVELHCSDTSRTWSYAYSIQQAQRALPKVLPSGAQVVLHCWKEREGAPRLHNRYILTDIGGVQFGDSIETGEAGHEDRLSILDDTSWKRLLEQYAGPTPMFDPAGPPMAFVGEASRASRV
jgi:hypothetical protein